jgi:hypothetical protein
MTASKKYLNILCIIGMLILPLFVSCIPVKEYQKIYLNDPEMELYPRRVENSEINFELYREGASGGNGGKASGGCGCN